MIDIADKLFPNILTLLAQLAATGVLYVLYRKYVHTPVMSYLNRQAQELQEADQLAAKVEEDARQRQAQLELEFKEEKEKLMQEHERQLKESLRQRDAIIHEAHQEKQHIIQQGQLEIEQNRQAMLKEVEEESLNIAVDVAQRVLENYSYDQADIVQGIQKELEKVS